MLGETKNKNHSRKLIFSSLEAYFYKKKQMAFFKKKISCDEFMGMYVSRTDSISKSVFKNFTAQLVELTED